MSQEFDLQKARAKSLAAHFKKAAAHHEKMAEHHEKIYKAHEAVAEHHESMMGKAEDMHHAHHKAKAAFHKTMAGHHEKIHKAHKAHAEHHAAMADAHSEDAAATKAAFEKLEIPLEKAAEVPPVQAAPVQQDPKQDAEINKTSGANMPEPKKTDPTPAPAPQTAAQISSEGIQKQFNDGLQKALQTGLQEALNSPDFKKTIQEQIGNLLLQELGKQVNISAPAPTPVKTFAVPRTALDSSEVVKTIASGGTPTVDVSTVDAEFRHLVGMEI